MALPIPRQLEGLYAPGCIAYREKFNGRMHRYLRTRREYGDAGERGYFSRFVEGENLIVPHREILDQLGPVFDMIGVVCQRGDSAFLLTEQHRPGEFERSVGKTAIVLGLLGAAISYAEIPDTAESLEREGLRRVKGAGDTKLVCADKVYVGSRGGKLVVSAPKGEQLEAQWDMARHIARKKGHLDYDTAKGRGDQEAQAYQEALGEWYCLERGMFADERRMHPVSAVFIVSRGKASPHGGVRFEMRTDCFDELMRGPYHSSPYWDIDRGEHEKRARDISSGVTSPPVVWKIGIIPTEENDYLDMATEIISEKIESS